jgi:ribosomal protein S18 acetylase RimI-like enzyme
VLRALWIDEPDRRRGRATVAVLAAEEVLRAWGCDQVRAYVPQGATGALRLLESLGYVTTGRSFHKQLL